jgi:UDP-N-acetylglucosamine--N-acetylmuramyl-(pentapeptide) pyrophosphoryl-undecaprenol N-acetylglucosamine transferase
VSKLCVIAAGGTGGHLFPAQAMAEELIRRGWRMVLATDERGAQYVGDFPAEERIALTAKTYKRGNPFSMLGAALAALQGAGEARAAFTRLQPNVVVGFGGYPSAPGLMAAFAAKIPTVVHEQNAVLGGANRRLVGRATAVACAFPALGKALPSVAARAVVVGNPVRPEIRALANLPYAPPSAKGSINLLITGGSQGARLLSELMPVAIAQLPEDLRTRLKVQQQTRAESMDAARRTYADALVEAEIAPFFRDMAGRLKAAHLVVGRAGSGTVNEFAIAGKPAILIPLGIAVDDDQGQNAKVLEAAGGAVVLRENALTVDVMADALKELLTDPERLTRMSAAARTIAKPDAAERLADLVEMVAR